MSNEQWQRVVVVSLHKTGTTSFSQLMTQAGKLVTGPDGNLYADVQQGDFKAVRKALNRFEVFQDDPWYLLYPMIDANYPNTRFVYLERDAHKWLESVQRFYGRDRYNNAIRRDFYGAADTLENPELYLNKYQSHQQAVFDYFGDKENFISVRVDRPEDLRRLEEFLGMDFEETEFPHVNRTPQTEVEQMLHGRRMRKISGYGLKPVVKRTLKGILGHSKYIRLRSDIRFIRTKIKTRGKR